MPLTLFTIGYAGRTPAALVAALRKAGVERLVDVRALPNSRQPGFSKTPLAATLAEAGIVYEHVRPLGNPQPIRDRYRSGDVAGGAAEYRAHVERESRGELDALAASLEAGPAMCLLCLERDHASCHRDVVAAALAARLPGLEVVHL